MLKPRQLPGRLPSSKDLRSGLVLDFRLWVYRLGFAMNWPLGFGHYALLGVAAKT